MRRWKRKGERKGCDACELVVNKTLATNKYTFDILVKEGIINAVDEIFKVPRQNTTRFLVDDDRNKVEKIINDFLENRLLEHEQRLKSLEKVTREHTNELMEVKSEINLVKDRINEIKTDVTHIKSDIHSLNETTNKNCHELGAIKSSISNNHSETQNTLGIILQRLAGNTVDAGKQNL
ncbi:hypothetical protein BpHYR1_024443 [Brachionus plicatilis]|uniref:Uncharacterized protein n=1 Tax=Brachionus plicatilis TaxID=10195 RepID=A0A3M7SAR5_BRAPC|nr:hypothetical protein BpHYR1_024443 [Brachionus plicatilis]